MPTENQSSNTAVSNLQYIAFHCGQVMTLVSKLLQREGFTPMEQHTINKAVQQIEYAEKLLEKVIPK